MNTALIRVAIDLGVFDLLVKKKAPMSAQELAQATNADHAMLQRILRSLAAVHILNEEDVELYTPSKVAETFAAEKGVANLKALYATFASLSIASMRLGPRSLIKDVL